MEIQNILTLIQAFTENSLTELKVEDGGVKVLLKKDHFGAAGEPMISGAAVQPVQPQPQPAVITGEAVQPVQQPAVTPVPVMPAAAAVVPTVQPAAGVTVAVPVPEVQAAGAIPAVNPAAIASDKVVVSPLVGIFYSAPSPEAENFVKVGDTVKKGQVLGIIEAMKLMNEIESDYDGVIEAILVNNEDVVEYGQPLFRIR